MLAPTTLRVVSLLKNMDIKLSIKKFAFFLLHYFVAKSLLWFASNALISVNLDFSQVELYIIKRVKMRTNQFTAGIIFFLQCLLTGQQDLLRYHLQ